jgi:hypothetical protein
MKKILTLFVLPLVIFSGLLFLCGPNFATTFSLQLAPYRGDFYALALENGEFVYGKINSVSGRWIKLSDVYYFQLIGVGADGTKNLVAQTSNVLTTPANYLIINRAKIVSLEKIGPQSKLLEIIKQNSV